MVSARRYTWPPTTLQRPRSASLRWRNASRCTTGVRARRSPHALVGGFFVTATGEPLGELRGAGIRRPSIPFTAPWNEIRSCVQVEGGEVRIARRSELPADPRGDLLQAGPLLVQQAHR